MAASATVDYLAGTNDGLINFEEVDQFYRLKVRSFIRLCMPGVFSTLGNDPGLRAMRAQGIAPIMYFLQFESTEHALAFGQPVASEHEIRFYRAAVPPRSPEQAPGTRLLMDTEISLSAEEGRSDPGALGHNAGSGRTVPAGRMRGLHVITRPVAPPDARHLDELPEGLRRYTIHEWSEVYPTSEMLMDTPQAYDPQDAGAWGELHSVWGLPNTDINQHVNVQEYITGLENQFSRLLFGAGLPNELHRIQKFGILFRKPFFPGEPYAVRGRLLLDGVRTLMQGGYHRMDSAGKVDDRPSVVCRADGCIVPRR